MGKVGRRGPHKGRVEQRRWEAQRRDEAKAERERRKREYEALPEETKAEIEAARRQRNKESARRLAPILAATAAFASRYR